MRTERVVLFGTHFFCVLEWARFMGHRTKRILRIERKEYQTY